MNTLLIFFAFPIAVIIVSAILERILNNPTAVAALIFAFFIVITFAFFDETFLIATLAYTVLSYITAAIVRFVNSNSQNDEDDSTCGCRSVNNSFTVDTLGSNSSNSFGYRCNRFRR